MRPLLLALSMPLLVAACATAGRPIASGHAPVNGISMYYELHGPQTGVPLEWERLLSAPFIVSERYGTRCSTVQLVGRDGEARFVERSFDASGATTGTVDVRFPLEPGY